MSRPGLRKLAQPALVAAARSMEGWLARPRPEGAEMSQHTNADDLPPQWKVVWAEMSSPARADKRPAL